MIPISLVTVSVPPTVTKVKPFGHMEVIRDKHELMRNSKAIVLADIHVLLSAAKNPAALSIRNYVPKLIPNYSN